MSPEQASGKNLDARSDIFSFGVVLYELLSGTQPFTGPTNLETLQRVIHGAPPPIKDDIPAALRGVVDKALEKDPADRYQTMRELVIDLRRLARGSGQPVVTQPESQPSSGSAVQKMACPGDRDFRDRRGFRSLDAPVATRHACRRRCVALSGPVAAEHRIQCIWRIRGFA